MSETQFYEHAGRNHVRYYDVGTGKYLDHGRMIYKHLPRVGYVVKPFPYANWLIKEIKFPEGDVCIELYIIDIDVMSDALYDIQQDCEIILNWINPLMDKAEDGSIVTAEEIEDALKRIHVKIDQEE